ncbi:MAG TPA: ATP-binding protein, partial [Aquabacterium sp.]|nr:ATP-binding protein [Aquabacterium sp.]
TSGSGRYEILFSLSQPPDTLDDTPWAIRIDRMSFQHKVWLNGQLIHADLQAERATGRHMAYMAQIPASLFVPGVNKLEIEVRYGSLGGLSTPLIGRVSDVNAGHQAQEFLTQVLPRSINVVAGSFAAFLTLIWLKRRKEVAIGMLGLLCIVVSVRNWTYYVVHGPTLHPELSAWLYFSAQTLATVLLCAFAMAISRRWWPWLTRLLWITLIVFPIVGGIAATHGQLAQARAVLYPALLCLMLPALTLLLRVPTQYGGLSALGMVLGIAVSLVAGIHDYLRLQGVVSVMHTFWLPLASPITLASYGIVLINRFVQAVGEVEQHNTQLEARVEERTRDLVAANAAKGHFLAAASHDLRQPVAAVGLLSGLLRERLKHTDLQDMTQRLSDAVRSMESLLSGLLDLSRLEAGAIKPHRQAVDLGHMLKRIASHEREAAALKGVALRVHPTRATAFSDPVLLEQMVRNLIGNAVRYTQQGGVLVGVRHRGDRLSIQIWDTGAGIAPADQARIFEDFVQLGNPERNQAKGLGLGLAIVQRASRLLDHPIGLQSRVGRGSCFTIDVPTHQHGGLISPPVAPQAEQGSASTDKPLADRHIVVLDDDDAVRHALAARLKSWGAYVSALDSVDALDELLQRVMSIDMLITDHQLCDGDGVSAIRMSRELHPQLAVLLITGDTATPHLQNLMISGVPVLYKPFQADELLKVIELQLDVRGGQASTPTQRQSA